MVRLWCLAAALALFPISALSGETVTLSWDASADADVVGYRVHYGTASGGYNHSLDVGNKTTAAVVGLEQNITYYFVVTAYNSSKIESLPSNEVVYAPAPAATPAASSPTVTSAENTDVTVFTTSLLPSKASRSADSPAENAVASIESIPLGIESMQRKNSGEFQINIVGPSGIACQIQASTNHRDWHPLDTVILSGNRASFIDAQAATQSLRFYRLAAMAP